MEMILEMLKNINIWATFFRGMGRVNEDIFRDKYPYLCSRGKRIVYGISQRLRDIHPVPPAVMFKLYGMLVKPILLCGSDVWGFSEQGQAQIVKIMLHYCLCVLNVKANTSNVITFGECGVLQPSV